MSSLINAIHFDFILLSQCSFNPTINLLMTFPLNIFWYLILLFTPSNLSCNMAYVRLAIAHDSYYHFSRKTPLRAMKTINNW